MTRTIIKTSNKKDKEIRAVQYMKLVFFALWLICVAAIIWLAVKPGGIPSHNNEDKILHCLVFCILMLWPATTFDAKRNVAFAALFLLIAGGTMEFVQGFIPGRSADIMDVTFNVVGIVTGSIIGFLFRDSYQSLLPFAYVQGYIEPQE